MGTVEQTREQWAQWKARGEWTDRMQAVCAWLGQVPLTVTSQVAWAVMPGTRDSRLKMARAVMRWLRAGGVVEHRRVKYRDAAGRPEDAYRLMPEWAAVLGVGSMPLAEDWVRDWLGADVYADAGVQGLEFVWHPEGHSRADWVRTHRTDTFHVHAYGYMLDQPADRVRFVEAIARFQSAGGRPDCPMGPGCAVWFDGWDVARTLDPAAPAADWGAVVRRDLAERGIAGARGWSIRPWTPVKDRLSQLASGSGRREPAYFDLILTSSGMQPPTF